MQYHLVLKSSVVHSPYKKAHYVTPNDRKEYYMTKNELFSELDRIERFANLSRFQRLLTTPRKYLFGLLYKNLFYRMHSSGKRIFQKANSISLARCDGYLSIWWQNPRIRN